MNTGPIDTAKLNARDDIQIGDRQEFQDELARRAEAALAQMTAKIQKKKKPVETPKAEPAHIASGPPLSLRRNGQMPYVFRPVAELAFANSYIVSLPVWYEINLWLSDEKNYVLNIRRFEKSSDQEDTHVVIVSPSQDKVFEAIERYDPLRDLAVNIDLSPDMPMAEIAMHRLSLYWDMEITRRQYVSAVNDLFKSIED